jgi:glutamine synthetase
MNQLLAGSPPAVTPTDVASMRAWADQQGFVRVDLTTTGIATDSRWQPGLEFFLLPPGPLALTPSRAGFGFGGADGYHVSPPRDRHAGVRANAVELLESANIGVKYDHHERGPEGQMEIELAPGDLVKAADSVLLAKYEGAHGATFCFPQNLDEALDALAEDRAFLLEGGVFTEELLDEWTALKQRESNALALQPHPAEFDLYEDL